MNSQSGAPFPARLDIPSEVMAIARRLERAGHETWCIGGAVRDRLIGIPNNDVDLATSATPDQVQSLFRRTVPIGISHGTVAVLDRHNVAHEVTTFRKDVRTDGRHAEVTFGVSLEEDLARRDFTFNAIAYHPGRHEWFDPHRGADDLQTGIVRAVGVATRRFREDYLRILRCVRFATRFGFAVERITWQAARANGDGLAGLSAERVRDEWFKSLTHTKSVATVCAMWSDVGAGRIWLAGIDLEEADGRARIYALDRHNVRDPVFVTAYLSSDPGATLEKLRCSSAEIERGRRIAVFRADWPDVANPTSVRKWMSHVGDAVDDMILVARVDEAHAGLREVVEAVVASGAPLSQSQLAVNGSDLIRMGVPEGPEVGAMLKRLLNVVLEDPGRNRKSVLLQMAADDGENTR
jgi:tRNA nucleotidyltransferase (CCA-adding enzyme)